MKVFFLGTYFNNGGPDNVNKGLISVSDNNLMYLRKQDDIGKLFETLRYLRECDVVLISGVCSDKHLFLINLSKKPYAYIIHGDLIFENEVNNENIKKSVLQTQMNIFKGAKSIIAVSQKHSEWLKERYPQYSNKIQYVNNGVVINRREKKNKIPYSIAIGGGTRHIKANKYVCEAVKLLQNKGIDCQLFVFGLKYQNCIALPEVDNIHYMGQMNKAEFYDTLDSISIYIINSDVEPFGLSAADAVNCNCSLLLSQNVGASSIFALQDEDVICNNHDPEEIAQKIQMIEQHPNMDRIYDSIDYEEVTIEKSYEHLMSICRTIAQKGY